MTTHAHHQREEEHEERMKEDRFFGDGDTMMMVQLGFTAAHGLRDTNISTKKVFVLLHVRPAPDHYIPPTFAYGMTIGISA